MSEEIRIKDLGAYSIGVLEDAGATPQEWARFAHLAKRSPMGAFVAIMHIEAGAPVGETIDGCAEVARKRTRQ